MISQPSQPSQMEPASTEPGANRAPIPIWLIIFFFLLLYWGMVYFDQHGGWFHQEVYAPYASVDQLTEYQVPTGGGGFMGPGKANFEKNCALCHQNDGLGKPGQFPPLAHSEWVLGSPNRFVRIPLLGLQGSITVNGQPWNSAMAAMGAGMNDEDLAATLSYIRNSFGNKADEITPEQVKAIRGQIGGRAQPLTADELTKIPEK
jgi:mono/diheme cytochrome c family protein